MKLLDNEKNIAILVNSFDGYNDLWNIFWDIFDKYWSDCPFPKYLISNELKFERDGIINIKTGKEINWFDRTIKAMELVNEEYFIFFLEDYFLSKTVNSKDISDIVKKMKARDIFFYRLSLRNGLPLNQSFIKLPHGTEYAITLQLGIWKKEAFTKIIHELHNSGCNSPWEFETYLKNNYTYCPVQEGNLQGIRFDTKDLFGYKNAVLRGKWFPDVKKYYMQMGIDFSGSSREVIPWFQYMRYKFICFISSEFYQKKKIQLKKILTKLKIKTTI